MLKKPPVPKKKLILKCCVKKLISIIGGVEIGKHGAFGDSPLNDTSGTIFTAWMVPEELVPCHAIDPIDNGSLG